MKFIVKETNQYTEVGEEFEADNMAEALSMALSDCGYTVQSVDGEEDTPNKLIGWQPAAEEFPVGCLMPNEVYVDLEMGVGCHPDINRWVPVFENTIKNHIIIPSDKAAEEDDPNSHITILHHDISYYLDDNTEIELGDSESEHIEYMIGQGCSSGELNKFNKDDPEDNIRGWWSITKEI